MDHQSAISYGNDYTNSGPYNTYGLADYILLHETAHEWWGNSVTAKTSRHNWIHEGFATYAEVLFIERHYGYKRSLQYLENQRKQIRNFKALTGPITSNWRNWRDNDDYMKGCWILHTLRNTIQDDPVFFRILKTFATENRHKLVTSQTFSSLVNRMTGENYDWFFDQMLNQSTPPELQYYFEDGKLWYRWTNCRLDFNMPYTFKVGTSNVRVFPSTNIEQLEVFEVPRVFPDEDAFFAKVQWFPFLKDLSLTMGDNSAPANSVKLPGLRK